MGKNIRWSVKIEKFILDKMSEGYTIAEIKRNWPTECPDPKTVYRRSQSHPEWAEKLNQGYTLWYYCKLEELDKLSNGLASEIYPGVEFREAEAALKRRIDTLKFSLGKMAPIMSKRFDKAQKVEIEGNTGPQLAVINYYKDSDEKLIEQTINKDADED